MKTFEKRAWVLLLLAIVMVWTAYAMEIGPFTVTNSTGSPLHILDSSGYIQNSGAKCMTSTSTWVIKNYAGTSVGGFHYNGSLLCSTDNVSSTDLANGTAGETNETTVTFATAEPDTNYKIIGVLEDTADTTARAWVARRNTGTFVIKSDNINSTGYFTWHKVRAQ